VLLSQRDADDIEMTMDQSVVERKLLFGEGMAVFSSTATS
jgi:hypothetical protein